jgi:hypothetical protein
MTTAVANAKRLPSRADLCVWAEMRFLILRLMVVPSIEVTVTEHPDPV